jgi:hypothetical protein
MHPILQFKDFNRKTNYYTSINFFLKISSLGDKEKIYFLYLSKIGT